MSKKKTRARKPQPCVVGLTDENRTYYMTDRRRDSLRKYIEIHAQSNVREVAAQTAKLLDVKVEDLMTAIYVQVHQLACSKNAAGDMRSGYVTMASDPSLDLGMKVDLFRGLMGVAMDEKDPQTDKLLGPGKAWQEAVEAEEAAS